MRILITGIEGTLGRVLSAELSSRGHEVFGCSLRHESSPNVFRGDVSELRQLSNVFEKTKPEVVYHLAAEFGRVNGEAYYEDLWKTNCIGTRNVIEECVRTGARLVFASSSEVYGDADRYAPPNEYFCEGWTDRFAPGFHNEYALTKWTNERQIFFAAKTRGLKATVLRFFNAYGPGEFYSPYRSVVCLFVYRLMHGLPITVYKNYFRVFMWVGDWANTVANAATFAPAAGIGNWSGSLDSGVPVINVGGEEFLSVEELKDMILKEIGGSRSEISYLDSEAANVISKRPNVYLAKEFLGHDLKTPLSVGLPQTINWMRAQYPSAS